MSKREKVHPTYHFVKAHQKTIGLTDEQVATKLGMSVRTYNDKINGYSDFSLLDGKRLAELLGSTQEEIFLT